MPFLAGRGKQGGGGGGIDKREIEIAGRGTA